MWFSWITQLTRPLINLWKGGPLGKSIYIVLLPALVGLATQERFGIAMSWGLVQNLALYQFARVLPWEWVRRWFLKLEWFFYLNVWLLALWYVCTALGKVFYG